MDSLTARDRIGRRFLVAFCALVLFFLVAPLIAIMPLSFNTEPYFTYPMPGWSLKWYEEFFFSDQWLNALKNSAIVACFSTVLATALGTTAALGLSRANFPGKGFIMAVLISPMAVPIVVSAIGIYYFFAQMGLTNTLLGLILAHVVLGVPFVVITVTATLVSFDYNLVRAGESLGETPLRVFFKVTLPLIAPGVVSGALFAFITSWDEVVVVLFMAGPEQHTLPRVMWTGIREQISPTILAVATMLILLSSALMVSLELLRRRAEKLRGGKV